LSAVSQPIKNSKQDIQNSHYRFNKALITWPNTLQHVSAVQISHHQADVGSTKGNIKEERALFTAL